MLAKSVSGPVPESRKVQGLPKEGCYLLVALLGFAFGVRKQDLGPCICIVGVVL